MDYYPSKTISDFFRSDKRIRILRGPIGSGKTIACIMDLVRRAKMQAPNQNKVRKSRWVLVRDTYPELMSTTLKSFKDWITPDIASYRGNSPVVATIKAKLGDGTFMDAEFIFRAIDGASAESTLRSLEVTGIFLNELSTISREVYDYALSRVGRFPAESTNGIGCTWSGVIADTNSPNENHWLYELEMSQPENVEFFIQPSPLIPVYDKDKNIIGYDRNPAAENVENLRQESRIDGKAWTFEEKRNFGYKYYEDLIYGHRQDWIDTNILNKYGKSYNGKGVYDSVWNEACVSQEPLFPQKNTRVICGVDTSGLNSAVVFSQIINGTVMVYHELIGFDLPLDVFMRDLLLPFINEHYSGFDMTFWLDFANPRASITGMTPLSVFHNNNLKARLAPTNKFLSRYEAVANKIEQEKGLLIDKRCKYLLDGFRGLYYYKMVRAVGASGGYKTDPFKNDYSHIQDAMQYLMLGIKIETNTSAKHFNKTITRGKTTDWT